VIWPSSSSPGQVRQPFMTSQVSPAESLRQAPSCPISNSQNNSLAKWAACLKDIDRNWGSMRLHNYTIDKQGSGNLNPDLSELKPMTSPSLSQPTHTTGARGFFLLKFLQKKTVAIYFSPYKTSPVMRSSE